MRGFVGGIRKSTKERQRVTTDHSTLSFLIVCVLVHVSLQDIDKEKSKDSLLINSASMRHSIEDFEIRRNFAGLRLKNESLRAEKTVAKWADTSVRGEGGDEAGGVVEVLTILSRLSG